MAFKDDFKENMSLVGSTISDVSAILVEKNKIKAQAARVKQIIRGDTITRDNAYIELGKYFYDNLRANGTKENEDICLVIDKMNDRIEKASLKYVELQELQSNTKIQSENAEKLKEAMAIQAAQLKEQASQKAQEFGTKAKDFAAEKYETAKDFAVDTYNKAKEKVAPSIDKVEDFFEEKKESVEDFAVDTKIKFEDKVEEIKDKAEDFMNRANVKEDEIDEIIKPAEEESPDSFEF